MKCGFSGHFIKERVLNLGHEPLKSHSKIRSYSFVNPSKIFVWEGKNDLQAKMLEASGRANKPPGSSFRCTFQRFLAKIECSFGLSHQSQDEGEHDTMICVI